MMLQALCELADRERLVEDPDFELKPVAWIVTLGPGGHLLGVQGTKEEKRAKSFMIPRRWPSRSGAAPAAEYLADNSKFVLGWPTADKHFNRADGLKALERFESYVRDVGPTDDAAIAAVLKFLERAAKDDEFAGTVLPPEAVSNDVIAFRWHEDPDRLVSERPAVVAAWRKRRQAMASGATAVGRCLVTGTKAALVDKHDKVKSLPGGNTSGAALISFNQLAFCSYGWAEHENARISQLASQKFSIALNRLLSRDPEGPNGKLPRRNLQLGAKTVVCYWAKGTASEDLLDALAGLLDGDAESVGEVYRSIWRGRPATLTTPDAFFALVISGAEGRAVVRQWIECTTETVNRNLSQHFQDLDIVRSRSDDSVRPFSLRSLLTSLVFETDEVPGPLAAKVFEAILQGHEYPFSVLQRCVARTQAEIGRLGKQNSKKDLFTVMDRMDARAALLKAFLNRRARKSGTGTDFKEIEFDMDPTNQNPGYLLGQLMAVLERLQQLAIGDPNASIVDRYFSGATGSPRLVFKRLLQLSMKHARKAKDDEKSGGLAMLLEKAKDQILGGFDVSSGGIPSTLSLTEQAHFILGYHHMRRWIWLSSEQRALWSARYPNAGSGYQWGTKTNSDQERN